MAFFSDGDGGTPSISVQAANLWYDIRGTYIVYFVADGCRKNLPLGDLAFSNGQRKRPITILGILVARRRLGFRGR